mgnify:FL=1
MKRLLNYTIILSLSLVVFGCGGESSGRDSSSVEIVLSGCWSSNFAGMKSTTCFLDNNQTRKTWTFSGVTQERNGVYTIDGDIETIHESIQGEDKHTPYRFDGSKLRLQIDGKDYIESSSLIKN